MIPEDRERLQNALTALLSCSEHIQALEQLTVTEDVARLLSHLQWSVESLSGALFQFVLEKDLEGTGEDVESFLSLVETPPLEDYDS